MMTMPGASCAPATSAISASLTTSTRDSWPMRRMMARTVRASSSRSTPAMPRQIAAGAIVAIADRLARSRRAAPSRPRARPRRAGSRPDRAPPRGSGRARRRAGTPSSCRPRRCRARACSDDLIARAAPRIYLVSYARRFGTLARPERCPHGADLGRLSRHRRLSRSPSPRSAPISRASRRPPATTS